MLGTALPRRPRFAALGSFLPTLVRLAVIDPFGVGEQAVTDAVELADAFGHGAETVFLHLQVIDGVIVVVLLGLGHAQPFPGVVADRYGVAQFALAVLGELTVSP